MTDAEPLRLPLLFRMGPRGRAWAALPGWTAGALAWLLGAQPVAVLVALILFVAPVFAPRAAATLALMAAPLVLSATLPFATLASWPAVFPAATAAMATLPLFLHLGGAYPVRYLPVHLAAVIASFVLVVLMVSPTYRLLILASDVATALQIGLVALAVAVVDGLVTLRARRSTAPAHE